jgi:hypothetical protein
MVKTGPRGPKGKHSARGARGERGQRGERGPAGPVPSRAQILAAVDDQLAEIRKQLAIQLTRFGQLQMQVDSIQKLLKQAINESD